MKITKIINTGKYKYIYVTKFNTFFFFLPVKIIRTINYMFKVKVQSKIIH